MVGDPEEARVMEMCGYDPSGKDGIWVAQRVPDNGFFAAANEFRIREVRKDSDDMMYSDNLFEVCEKPDWWNPMNVLLAARVALYYYHLISCIYYNISFSLPLHQFYDEDFPGFFFSPLFHHMR